MNGINGKQKHQFDDVTRLTEKEERGHRSNRVPEGATDVPMRALFRYATKGDIALMCAGAIFGVCQGGLASTSSYINKNMINALIDGQKSWENANDTNPFDYDAFEGDALPPVNLYSIYGGVVFILGFLNMCCWHTVAQRQMHHIRIRYFEAVLRQNMGWFDKNETGALTTKMTDGVDRIKDGIGDKLGAMCAYSAQFIGGITTAFVLSWKMTLIMMCFTPLFLTPMIMAGRFIKRTIPQELRAYGKAGAVAEEVVSGIRTVAAFNGQEKEIKRYEDHLRVGEKFGIRKAFFTAAGTATVFCALFIAMENTFKHKETFVHLRRCFYFGTVLVTKDEISPGVVFGVFWAVISGSFALGHAAPQIGTILGAKGAAAPIFAIIDREPTINSQSKKGKMIANPRGTIELNDIHFRYPTREETKILKGISLKIEPGEHVALVGHSGSGKSTLLGLLLRFYEQEQGKVTIDGEDVRDINIAHLRQIVGVVSQEPSLFADSVANNLRLGNPEMSLEDMERVCRMANAHDFVELLPEKYETKIGEGGVQLSGGQKQRIAIARALARNPRVLLLDEATSALDTESEAVVQRALDQAGQGRTTISIAHRLSTIKGANRIYVFDSGVIVESGNHETLMSSGGLYSELVKAQEIEKAEEKDDLDRGEKEDQFDDSASESSASFTSSGDSSLFEETGGVTGRRFSRMKARTTSRLSTRMSRALSMSSEIDRAILDLEDEVAEEKAAPSSILDILKFARPEWLWLLVALCCSIIRGLTFPIFSLVYGRMFKMLSSDDPPDVMKHHALINGLYFWGIGISCLLSAMTSGFLMGKSGESITMRMRLRLFRNILRQDGSYFDNPNHSSGKLTTRLASDAPNIRAAIDQRLADVLQSISAISAGIIIAFSYGPIMAPIGVLTAVTLMTVNTLITQYLKRKGQRDAEVAEEPSRLATEAIEQHKTVQSLTRERHFVEKYVEMMAKPHRNAISRGLIQSLTFALSISYVLMNFAIAFRYGIWLVKLNKTSPYIVFQVIEALNCASISLMAFATYFPEYIRARLSAGLLFNMLGIEPRIDSLVDGGKKPTLNGDVDFDRLYFSYPVRKQHMVLNGIQIKIPRGKTVALVGPSGCGKSTSIQMIERYYDPIGGRLLFDGIDCREINLQHLRSQISLVGQEPILFNYSIRENIAYGVNAATEEEVIAAAKLANAHDFISKLPAGYNTVVGEKGSQLSGGQKQRVAIARAVIRDPKILLLDEATSALDTESERIVQEALERASTGRTCLVIAHRLSSIQNADIIVVVKDGRVYEQGNHQSLLARKGLYANLVAQQGLS
ncbi:unnamed protein product, partial [Mesorhabditis belari]|uniref:Uncharacterized protein n=1 Tax=Mesorhabditis belari TaxID=2138241 RepID=A0AAF3FG85_9BILA